MGKQSLDDNAETIFIVKFLMPREWAGEGKRLDFAEEKYKSKGWAEKFFEKEPLTYRLLKAKQENLGEGALGIPLKRRSEKEVLKTKPIPKSKLEKYFVSSTVERTLEERGLIE